MQRRDQVSGPCSQGSESSICVVCLELGGSEQLHGMALQKGETEKGFAKSHIEK